MNLEDVSPVGCPKCHSFAIYRSMPRGVVERVRKHFTSLRPYRCHDCQWRGWLYCIRYAEYPVPMPDTQPPK